MPLDECKKIDICLCTFRRNHVTKTLESLKNPDGMDGWHIRIIVADNDETPSAEERVRTTAEKTGLDIIYIHAPARNISIARNACLDHATAPLIAFIDDDEIATPHWLSALVEKQREGWDAVLGPVKAIYAPDQPHWMHKGDFHTTLPVWVNGEIITGYTCNALLNRASARVKNLRFLEQLGKTGGEDSFFFATLHQQGGKIGFTSEALLVEEVPAARARFGWLFQRRFRSGQTHGFMLMELAKNHSFSFRLKQTFKALMKFIICIMMGMLTLYNPVKARFWLLRSAVHLGVIMRMVGQKELVLYG